MLRRKAQVESGKYYPCKECSILQVGFTFGSWTVIRNDVKRSDRRRYEIQCICGRTVFIKKSQVKNNHECRECRSQRFDDDAFSRCLRAHEYHYQSGAESRNYEYNLSTEIFSKLVEQNCVYCDGPPSVAPLKKYPDILFSGIDRKDNSKGYIDTNVVSCCIICNRAKMDKSYEEFMDWISRLVAFQRGEIS